MHFQRAVSKMGRFTCGICMVWVEMGVGGGGSVVGGGG